MDSGNNAKLVKSDERLFRIIQILQEKNGAGVTEIANEMDIAKSAVYNHLATLTHHGYTTKDGHIYHIGLRFLFHGIFAREQKIIYRMTRSRIDELANKTNELAWCQTHENGMAVYIYGASGKHSVYPSERVGNRRHMHKIAGGKAMLAFFSESEVERIIDHYGLPPATSNTITAREELLEELESIRERKVAFNREEAIEGVHSLATPVLGPDNDVLGAIGLSGPKNRLKGDWFENELSDLLLGTANEIEVKIEHKEFSHS